MSQPTIPKGHRYAFGMIGNCAYNGLIDQRANIKWLCLPRFDSSFVFGSLLDEEKGGNFAVEPEWDTFRAQQEYIANTNVLQTTFHCEDGSFCVTDFAPRYRQYDRYYKPLFVMRKIEPLRGRPRVRVRCNPVGNYGEIKPQRVFGSSHIRYEGLGTQVRLTTNIPLNYVDTESAFVLNETKYLVFAWGAPFELELHAVEDALQKTISYWRNWVKATSTEHFFQSQVIRSILTLKLHQYQDTGAIIASATTSLTEFPRSARTWDYRYCWLRDAYYTIKMLGDTGHFTILEDYLNFIENIALNEDGRFRPLYPIALDHEPKEKNLPLAGYLNERPVRVGNDAYFHTQNDVYGQVLVTLLPFFSDSRLNNQDAATLINLVSNCLTLIEETMNEPDNGPWGLPSAHDLHCYTFLFHWAGSNAAKKMAIQMNDETMLQRAEKLIERAAQQIENCFDEERGVYTAAIGADDLDASVLQLVNMGYLDPNSPRAKQHIKVLEEELLSKNGIFYRYRFTDDYGATESTFLVCTFWYAEALAKMGSLDEARRIFENALQYSNHLGLFSEGVHEETNAQWGNFPMADTHVALINAAFSISKKLDKPDYL
ncbi:MAG: hypothetical protein RL757_2097 [Bacteroidota bacterium]|jgi:GH15 family glucan-1,4-alpha-glucosidase